MAGRLRNFGIRNFSNLESWTWRRPKRICWATNDVRIIFNGDHRRTLSKTMTMTTNGLLDFWTKSPAAAANSIDADIVYGQSHNLQVKRNVAYIVAGICIRGTNTNDAEVLLIQEVADDWYLPAGRLEAGESIENGMKREVKEEAGIDCESLGLISVDAPRHAWYRFAYLVKQTGGTLKTPAERDCESIQAAWFRVQHVIDGTLPADVRLRCKDIVRLIRLATTRNFEMVANDDDSRCHGMMIERPLIGLYARFVLACGTKVLLRRDHFPMVEYPLYQHLAGVLLKFLSTFTTDEQSSLESKVISVESSLIPAYEHDGMCLTILIELPSAALASKQSESLKDGYEWIDTNTRGDQQLIDSLQLWRAKYAVLHF